MVYQYSYARREIFMNGKKEAPIDSWMGWSNARWEGDTLVIDVTGLNDQSWFDRRAITIPTRCMSSSATR
jgi:hypothetical protein